MRLTQEADYLIFFNTDMECRRPNESILKSELAETSFPQIVTSTTCSVNSEILWGEKRPRVRLCISLVSTTVDNVHVGHLGVDERAEAT